MSGIAKVLVLFNAFGKRRIPKKIRMDHEHPARALSAGVRIPFNTENLARGDKEHDPLIKVIFLLPVSDLTADVSFEGYGVKVIHPAIHLMILG